MTITVPSQTLISTSAAVACAGKVAVFTDGLTTIIELFTIPSATPFPQLVAAATVQMLTQSGVHVV